MTPKELEKIRARHHEERDYRGMLAGPLPGGKGRKDGIVPRCVACNQLWPCDAAQLLEHVDTAREIADQDERSAYWSGYYAGECPE